MSMRCKVKLGPDGVWFARAYLGLDARGRQIRPYRSFPDAESREDAQAMADEWAADLTADGRVASARLADLLADYVDMRERFGASPNSVKAWRLFSERYVADFVGRSMLARDFRAADANRLERRLLLPRSEGGAGLSRSTVVGVHYFLRAAFGHFVEAGVCESNPMVSASKPSTHRADAYALDEWDFAAVDSALADAMGEPAPDEAALRGISCALAAWLSLRTGIRCGEACALRRRDVSRQRKALHVGGTVVEEKGRKPYRRGATKGKKSRNVALTERELAACDAAMRAQDAVLGRLPPDAPLLTADGSFMRPSSVSRAFSELRDSLGLPERLTFHGLRHTHACWWLSHGGDLKSLSERLGHADEAMTLRVYAHVMPGRDAQMAEVVSAAMAEARQGADACGNGVATGPFGRDAARSRNPT